MNFDRELIAGKLRRWGRYLNDYRLPAWDEIPDLGLYMEQVVTLLKGYLDYLPPELKDEQIITRAAINNYVRTKVMPEPKKKKYYRIHIAYLILICSLKQGLSLSLVQKLIPTGISEAEVYRIYTSFAERHRIAAQYFTEQVKTAAAPLLVDEGISGTAAAVDTTEDLIIAAVASGSFARLLAEKLILLDGRTLEDGGDID